MNGLEGEISKRREKHSGTFLPICLMHPHRNYRLDAFFMQGGLLRETQGRVVETKNAKSEIKSLNKVPTANRAQDVRKIDSRCRRCKFCASAERFEFQFG